MKTFTSFILLLISISLSAQKIVYIPNYLKNRQDINGAQFSFSKTAQSTNYILIWGDSVGTNPANFPDKSIRFSPQQVLDTLEIVYSRLKATGFLVDSPGKNMAKYKIPVIVANTWGAKGTMDWASAGNVDGVIGAAWMHPGALQSGRIMAHEFTHALQTMIVVDKLNPVNKIDAFYANGLNWESHANFMANQFYPTDVTSSIDLYHYQMPEPDWKVAYECYLIMQHIQEKYGMGMVNRLWFENYSTEFLLNTFKRILQTTQTGFNNEMFTYVRRMAMHDFSMNNWGYYLRNWRRDNTSAATAEWTGDFKGIQRTYDILKEIDAANGRYAIPEEIAPQDYGYNIIPIYPKSGEPVTVKFKGHKECNNFSGWRYAFVTGNNNGITTRYTDTFSSDTATLSIQLTPNETKLFLVVMGAPTDKIHIGGDNTTWNGDVKRYHYPYELTITNGYPEGFQPNDFRAGIKKSGHKHLNGGGWVENTATVAASVYVGPKCFVLGNSKLSGKVKLTETAVVRNSTISDNAQIKDNAFVLNCTLSGNPIIKNQCYVENCKISGSAQIGGTAVTQNYTLGGTVVVGGDAVIYNEEGICNSGVYNVMTQYYENKMLQNDGRTELHPDNVSVNKPMIITSAKSLIIEEGFMVHYNNSAKILSIINNNHSGQNKTYTIASATGIIQLSGQITNPIQTIDLSKFAKGTYLFYMNGEAFNCRKFLVY